MPSRHGLGRIFRMQNSLHRHRAFPGVAIALDLFPGKCAAHARARIGNDLVRAGAWGRIVADGRKARVAVAHEREQPFWTDHHFVDHPRIRAKLMGEPGVGLTRPRGADRHVKREREHLCIDRLRAPHQIEADLVIIVPEPIKLQPEHIRRGFRCLFYGGAAGDTERVGHTRTLRGSWPSANRRPATPATGHPWAQPRSEPSSFVRTA